MANINLKRTEIMRVDAEFKKYIENLSRFKSNQEKADIKCPRITKAVFNQFMKYPELEREIKLKNLKTK